MTISETKDVINEFKDDLREKYSLEWLEYTLNYSQEKRGFYKCDIYISKNGGIKSDYGYISENINKEILKKSIDLLVKCVACGVRV